MPPYVSKNLYINLSDVNELQTRIMEFIGIWVHEKKTPIPRAAIIEKMQKDGINMPTTRNALYSLLRKGYIREAVTISNKTLYVALRSV